MAIFISTMLFDSYGKETIVNSQEWGQNPFYEEILSSSVLSERQAQKISKCFHRRKTLRDFRFSISVF